MPSVLRTFTLFWNSGLRFFIDPRTLPRRRLDWESENADGTPFPLGYGAQDFCRPRRLFHERSDGASAMLVFGYDGMNVGVSGPEPVPAVDGFLRICLYSLQLVTTPPPGCLSLISVFGLQTTPESGPWTKSHINTSWCEELSMPRVFDKLLDRMALSFETMFDQYCQSRRDHLHESRLCSHLFRVVLHMERVLFWLSRMGFGVAWSARYDQLLVRLFPEVYPETSEATRTSELAGLRSRLLGFHRPEAGPRHGPAPFEAPLGIACIRLIPIGEPDVRSGFQPALGSSVYSARGETVRFSTTGILEHLNGLTSSDGQWSSPEETAVPGHVLVGDELDLEIIAAGLPPSDFLGATSTTTVVYSPSFSSSRPLSLPAPDHGLGDRRTIVRGYPFPTPCAFGFSNAFEDGDDEILGEFLVLLWEHLGGGSFLPLQPDPRWSDLTQTRLSTTYGEFLLLRPAPSAARASVPRRSTPSSGNGRGPTATTSSGSEAGSSEDETPAPKRHKTSCPYRPEMVEVTDEDDAPTTADDPWNYDFDDEDAQMSSPEPPIAADPRNYDSELEPVPDAVPVEQQASSSRMTLDDPPPQDVRFLGFRLRPAAEIASASRASLVEEILQQSAEDVGEEGQLESALLAMSEVFGQAGRLLGQRRRGDKGKGKGRVP
ncbi:hypothetical protein B0H14DRAFT_3467598 [Mycena olivaceomarginata]|nr:hypothetical protein B0H14DRAFT_3467598 [Mycena olivaceomarginata]